MAVHHPLPFAHQRVLTAQLSPGDVEIKDKKPPDPLPFSSIFVEEKGVKGATQGQPIVCFISRPLCCLRFLLFNNPCSSSGSGQRAFVVFDSLVVFPGLGKCLFVVLEVVGRRERVACSGKTAAEIAQEFGVNFWNLRDWKRQYGSSSRPVDAPVPKSPEEMSREIQQLRRELARVTMQRDILKKTMGILSEEYPSVIR